MTDRFKRMLPLTLVAMACAQAHGMDLDAGNGIKAKINGVVTFGTQVRVESPSPEAYSATPAAAIGAPAGLLQGQTGGSNLNFAKGRPVSTVLKGVADLDLSKDNLGLFVRTSAWKDFSLGERGMPYGNYGNGFTPGAPLSDAGFAATSKFSGATIRDAFAYGKFKLDGGKTLDARLGRQVLAWGGSQMIGGGIGAATNPLDYSSQLRPGAQPYEAKLPVGMLSLKLDTAGPWSVDGFVAFEFRQAALPGCGTFYDVASYAPQNCNFATLSAFGPERGALAAGNYLHRGADVDAGNSGQFGLALGYKSLALDTDFKFYAMNTHSSMPTLRMTVTNTAPANALQAIRGSTYAALFPENVHLFGTSFAKKLDATTSAFGELAYRPNQPVSLNAYDLIAAFVTRSPTSALALNKGVLGIPAGGTFDAYDRFGVVTGSVGASKVFPRALGAQRALVVGELGFSRVNGLPQTSTLRYGRPLPYNGAAYTGGPACVDAVPGKTCTSDGYVSRTAWGLRGLVSATYPGAALGATLTPSLLVAKDVSGWSHDGTFSQGRLLLRPALRAEWSNQVFAELQYTRFSGGAYNLLVDRDNVGLTVGMRF